MAEIIRMPLMSDSMTKGTVAKWHKNIGDKVSSGTLLAEIETDKATMDFESPEDGILLFTADAGKDIAVNAILAIIGKANENINALLTAENALTSKPIGTETPAFEEKKISKADQTQSENKTQQSLPVPLAFDELTTQNNERLKASPLAKKIAKQNNINLQQLKGTGDEGRIVKRDVEAALQTQSTSTPKTQAPTPQTNNILTTEEYIDTPLSQMRQTIARRLSESKFTAPHFYLKMSINMDNATKARQALNEVSPVKISFNDLIVKAVAVALQQHPSVNSSWLNDKIRTYTYTHIGVAVAVEQGLVVPVVKYANQKTLSQIAAETKELAQKATNKKLQPSEMQGNTFTVSNLGMLDIEEFTAIINSPDSCILAVGKIMPTPVVIENEIKIAQIMKITLSCDHRSVDGATGAKFLQTLKLLLEDPIRLLI